MMGTMNGFEQANEMTRFTFQMDRVVGIYIKNRFEGKKSQPTTVD